LPRVEHLAELALRPSKFAGGSCETIPVTGDRLGEAASFAERMAGALIELLDFIGDVPEQRPEITHSVAQRMLDRRKIAPAR